MYLLLKKVIALLVRMGFSSRNLVTVMRKFDLKLTNVEAISVIEVKSSEKEDKPEHILTQSLS